MTRKEMEKAWEEHKEKTRRLRMGEEVKCSKCKTGIMTPIGNRETTNTFSCSNCNSQIILN